MREPKWIPRLVVEAIHDELTREHGGLSGLRDEGLLEASLARPRHQWAYRTKVDHAQLAAAYAFALARNHPFRDGNKRVAFVTAVTFLELNGRTFDAPEEDVISTMFSLAAGKTTEAAMARWLRKHIR